MQQDLVLALIELPAPHPVVVTFDPGLTFTTNAGIGARGDQGSSGFLGMVDELSIYSRDLTADEIQAIFNAGPAGKCPPGLKP
jgi:hypothetical protein